MTTGSWYKIGVKETGIYIIDIPFFKLGINAVNLASSSYHYYMKRGTKTVQSMCGTVDVLNNSNELVPEFVVAKCEEPGLNMYQIILTRLQPNRNSDWSSTNPARTYRLAYRYLQCSRE